MTAYEVITSPVAIENAPRTIWYVRPEGGGPYGAADGTSYNDAFEGLENLTFGDGAGDIPRRGHQIYVCGRHQLKQTGFDPNVGNIVTLSGEEGMRNVWRGDAPEEAGIIDGGYVQTDLTWTLDTDSTYTATLPGNMYGDNWFDLTGGGFQRLVPQDSIANAKATAGSIYSVDYNSASTVYVHLFDNSDPNTNNPMMSRFGYRLFFGGKSYLDFVGIASNIFRHISSSAIAPSYTKWQACQFHWAEERLMPIWNACNDLEWLGCDFAWAGNAIYFLGLGNQQTCIGWRAEGCTFTDIGNRDIDANSDSHAIGVQGTQNGIARLNTCRRTGVAIQLFADFQESDSSNQPMNNILIELNDIDEDNGRITPTESTPAAIGVSFDNDYTGETPNIVIRDNDIANYHHGIRYNSRTQALIELNRIDNCDTALQMNGGFVNGDGSNVKFHTNTVTGTNTRQIDARSPGKLHIIDSDNNFFTGVDVYRWDGGADIDFTAWQALTDGASVFDPNSSGP